MDHIMMFDDPRSRGNLLPFTFTRPVAEIRIGILKISEKWEHRLQAKQVGFLTQDYLQTRYPSLSAPALYINGALCPDDELVQAVEALNTNESLWHQDTLLASYLDKPGQFQTDHIPQKKRVDYEKDIRLLGRNWQIFQWNGSEIAKDFEILTKRRVSWGTDDPHTHLYNEPDIFIEKGAKIKAAILNASNGPIYIGKHAEIMEGALIRGPFALCEDASISMGAKIRENTTVGPKCKVGGEVSNVVFMGYSNKSHDGYMGNSVVGEWCNFGANTVVSNLKNNHMPVKVWDYTKGGFGDTGLQFCGSMVADHAKLGIGTTLNTGTVIGVGANLFGEGFPRKFVSSFAWGGAAGFSTFKLMRFEETAQKAMAFKGMEFGEAERAILQKVFELTRPYRIWDKEF
ncbi:UDP-N-acetylglucosamine diphosphorylase/glucosamine-1-phosphate N-acetyltransferase [Cyclobacterium lianum]|uniref:UDP-N-acetylglucosamine diphosphorylase/glucosamine-1-phosphate N-acetyltransferase n=1 Tax=Cyclobacterium lianum TaxID=388280 RepID=A0A1M7NI21_9BACT|nr:GlmU family protein [Cyclobacterium lianum]SHN03338.1 UDP-N-acetylglucosamine diphosphorylase/glucosamine-1-phosphate N-acetyltransferase [Cyclobacterium lianum]